MSAAVLPLGSLSGSLDPQQFANEHLYSTFGYPKQYANPAPKVLLIAEQIRYLARMTDVDPTHAYQYLKQLPDLPEGAEGWFAVLAAPFDSVEYCMLLEKSLMVLGHTRSCGGHKDGKCARHSLRVNLHTARAIGKLHKQQPGAIHIIAAQLGLVHRASSMRRALALMNGTPQFALEAIAGASIAITHPGRFDAPGDLEMQLAGTEFYSGLDDGIMRALAFSVSAQKCLMLEGRPTNYTDVRAGSASGFLFSPREQ